MNSKIADTLLLLTAILWGLGYIGADLLIAAGMNSISLVAIRFLIAFIILGILFRKRFKINKESIKGTFIVGTVLYLAFIFQTVAINYTTVTNVSFLTGINIVFIPFIMYIFYKDKIGVKNIISIVLIIMGVYILTGGIDEINFGDILTLISAFFFAVHIVLIAKFSQKIEIYTLAVGQMFFTSMLAFISLIFIHVNPIVELGKVNLTVMLFVGVIPSAVCFLLQNIGLQNTETSKGSIILSTEALWGALFAILLLGENLSYKIVLGGILMFVAIFIAEEN